MPCIDALWDLQSSFTIKNRSYIIATEEIYLSILKTCQGLLAYVETKRTWTNDDSQKLARDKIKSWHQLISFDSIVTWFSILEPMSILIKLPMGIIANGPVWF